MAGESAITPDSIIADILREHPECIEVFDRHSMPCLSCMGASTGTLQEGAAMHDVDVEVLVRELNECSRRPAN